MRRGAKSDTPTYDIMGKTRDRATTRGGIYIRDGKEIHRPLKTQPLQYQEPGCRTSGFRFALRHSIAATMEHRNLRDLAQSGSAISLSGATNAFAAQVPAKLHIFVKSNHWFSARLVRVRNRNNQP